MRLSGSISVVGCGIGGSFCGFSAGRLDKLLSILSWDDL